MSYSPGPVSAADDEAYIGKHPLGTLYLGLSAAPLVVSLFADTKWVVATGASATVFLLGFAVIYLNGLAVRLRRTNIYINEMRSKGRHDADGQ